MKKIMTIVTALLLAFSVSACAGQEELVILTSSGYEPYEMIDENGELIGFDIDLMNAIAEYLEISIEWKDVDFDGIIASLQTNQADAAIAGISPTAERAEVVDFTVVYFSEEGGLINMMLFDPSKVTITSVDDLAGLTVGAQLGTIQAGLLDELSQEIGFTTDFRNQNAQIVQEIALGNIDVLVVEQLVASSILAANEGLSQVALNSDLQSAGNAIALPKDSPYTAQFNEAILALTEDGTIQSLVEKWFNE
jgi:arginine/lysine/histidine transporter system substrate-binding protein